MVMLRSQKGGIVIAKSIFSQEYEIHFYNFASYRYIRMSYIIRKQNITQSRTDLEIFRQGDLWVSLGVGSSLSGI